MVLIEHGCLTNGQLTDRASSDTRSNRGSGVARCLCIAVLGGLTAFFTVSPVSAADVINGSKVYSRHCAACHGPAGTSVMPAAPHLARGDRMMQSDLALLSSLKAGKNAMPAYVGLLTDREILDVIAFSRTLRK